MTVLALTEPDGRPVVFDAQAIKSWRLVSVASYSVAQPVEAHTPHSLTCKSINRT